MTEFFQDLHALIVHNSFSCPPTCFWGAPFSTHFLFRFLALILSWKCFPTKCSRYLLLFYAIEICFLHFLSIMVLFALPKLPGQVFILYLLCAGGDAYLRSKFFQKNKNAPQWSWNFFLALGSGIIASFAVLAFIFLVILF